MYSHRNPAMNRLHKYPQTSDNTATYSGVALKAFYFVLLTMISAIVSFVFSIELAISASQIFIVLLIGIPIVAFILSLVAVFAPSTAPVTGSLYAVLQGFLVGFISLIFEASYGGVVFAALLSTIVVLLLMTVLYSTGIIRVGAFFKKFMISALLGILVSQLIIFIISLFTPALRILFYGDGPLSIIISVIMVIAASLMILFDFKHISEVVENKLDKKYEWVAAFGLLITIIWLYMEFLKLFAKIASSRKN